VHVARASRRADAVLGIEQLGGQRSAIVFSRRAE